MSQAARITADPLSDVLAVLGAQAVRGTRLEASGDWALSFQNRGRLKFVAVVRGGCWLRRPNAPPEALGEGGIYLLNNAPFTVSSDPALEPRDGMPLFEPPGRDVVRLGQTADTVMVGGGSTFSGGQAAFVLEALPSFLRVDPASPRAGTVARTLALLQAEVGDGGLGSPLVAKRLAEILLIEAIRASIGAGATPRVGWIAALADPQVGAALRLMHGDVARRWTASALAAEVGMSRSAFTERFSHRVGRPPLDYLILWRMTLARSKLGSDGASTARVAAEVGYSSHSAFVHAFKRTFGCTPRAAMGDREFLERFNAERPRSATRKPRRN